MLFYADQQVRMCEQDIKRHPSYTYHYKVKLEYYQKLKVNIPKMIEFVEKHQNEMVKHVQSTH